MRRRLWFTSAAKEGRRLPGNFPPLKRAVGDSFLVCKGHRAAPGALAAHPCPPPCLRSVHDARGPADQQHGVLRPWHPSCEKNLSIDALCGVPRSPRPGAVEVGWLGAPGLTQGQAQGEYGASPSLASS